MERTTLADSYLAEFAAAESALCRTPADWLHPLRKAAIARLAATGFPERRSEEWRYTSAARILSDRFSRAAAGTASISAAAVSRLRLLGAESPLLVFVNGTLHRDLSKLEALPDGVTLQSLAAALAESDARVERLFARRLLAEERLGTGAEPRSDDAFGALNTAFFEDGVLLEVEPRRQVTTPLEVLFLTSNSAATAATYPRNLYAIGREGRCALVESYAALDVEAPYLTNAVTEVVVEEGASFEHFKVVRDSYSASHVALQRARQAAGSRYANWFVCAGGRTVRNEVTLSLEGEGCESGLFGVYVVDGERHADNHTLIHHVAPRCHSREVYKGIIGGRATGTFSGKIFVHKDAQKTDAKQSNDNLLLSPDATANTQPRLEIYADDVRCTHGATVGYLDAAALFYLRSRGMPAERARALLTRAFADELFSELDSPDLRARLEAVVNAALPVGGSP